MSQINFIINYSNYKLPRSRVILDKIPKDKTDIFDLLVSDYPYHVHSQVPNAIFESFLNYWKSDTVPQIDFSNIWYYSLLSDEFGLMRDHLSSPENQSLFDLASLANMNKNMNLDISSIERRVAMNLNDYLTNQAHNLC